MMANTYRKCTFQSKYHPTSERINGRYTYKTGNELSNFFKHIRLTDYMSVSLIDYSEPSGLEIAYNIEESPVVFNFILRGKFNISVSGNNTKPITLNAKQGTSTIRVKNTSNIEGLFKILPSERYSSIAVHIDEMYLKDFLKDEADKLPEKFSKTLYEGVNPPFEERFISGINPSMMTAAAEALRYAKPGSINHKYLNSKANELICLKLFQLMELNNNDTPKLTKQDRLNIISAGELISKNLAAPPSVNELARMVGINRSKLQHGFKEEFGATVYEYLNHCRMEKALEILNKKEYTVYETAAMVGYSNVSKFIRAFKSRYGVTPGKLTTSN